MTTTTISAAEVRGLTLAHYQITALLKQPLPADAKAILQDLLVRIEEDCFVVSDNSSPSRWARSIVGSVLAAALGAATYMRDDTPTRISALRIFGLAGDRALSGQAAWKLMQPYVLVPTISDHEVLAIRRLSGLRLKLPEFPSTVDVLEELTRPRGGGFPLQITAWLIDFFRTHASDDTVYARQYQTALADMINFHKYCDTEQVNTRHIHGRPSRADWEALVAGRTPLSWLEERAATTVTRQFIGDYWDHWHAKC